MMGDVYDMNILTTAELETKLQEKLDSLHTPGPFKISVDDNDVDLCPGENYAYTFFIERGWDIPTYCYARYDDEGMMSEKDAELFLQDGHMVPGQLKKSRFLLNDSGFMSVGQTDFEHALQSISQTVGASVPESTEFIQGTQPFQGWCELIIEYPEMF